jgi:hypothetical protein
MQILRDFSFETLEDTQARLHVFLLATQIVAHFFLVALYFLSRKRVTNLQTAILLNERPDTFSDRVPLHTATWYKTYFSNAKRKKMFLGEIPRNSEITQIDTVRKEVT